MITIENLNVHYGDLQVLWDVSLEVREDDNIVAIVGPNGAGKTTLLKTLSGVLEPTSGKIEILGKSRTNDVQGRELPKSIDDAKLAVSHSVGSMKTSVASLPHRLRNRGGGDNSQTISLESPSDIVKIGFVQVSEERNLFNDLTVLENLRMGAYAQDDGYQETLQEVFDMFPILREREDQKAGTLSGGEQQMLAIGRGLMAQPKIIAFDEPSGALAPNLVEQVFEKIEEISEETTVVLVEQHVDHALALADRAYLLENGRVATEGTGDELLESDHIRESYLSA